jgi:hypothetical protein
MEMKEILRYIEEHKGEYMRKLIAENERLRKEREERRKDIEKGRQNGGL